MVRVGEVDIGNSGNLVGRYMMLALTPSGVRSQKGCLSREVIRFVLLWLLC